MADRLSIYRLFNRGPLTHSYLSKLLLVIALSCMLPLLLVGAYALAADSLLPEVMVMLTLAGGLAGILLGLVLLRGLLAPMELAAEAVDAFVEHRKLPELDTSFTDLPGRLLTQTQQGLLQLDHSRRHHEADRTTDPLTGLINKRAAMRRLGSDMLRATRDNKPMCVAVVEVAEVESVAAQFGHQSADEIVADVSRAISGTLRRSDWVACTGTNEFLIGLWGADTDTAVVALRRLVDSIGSDSDYPLLLNVGVASYGDNIKPEALIASAVSAMYSARMSDDERVIIAPDLATA